MTKEELEKEAEEYVKKLLEGTEFEDDDVDVCAYTKREMLEAILHFTEPREKRIAELEGQVTRAFEVLEGKRKQIQALGERCLQLQKDKGNFTDRVKELEAQIEKMKVCCNCDWSNYLPNGNCLDCDGKKNWKLKEGKRK